MPFTRKSLRKAFRQSDVMCVNENMDVMLENFPDDVYERQEAESENEVDLESRQLHRNNSQNGDGFRSDLNTEICDTCGLSAETSSGN